MSDQALTALAAALAEQLSPEELAALLSEVRSAALAELRRELHIAFRTAVVARLSAYVANPAPAPAPRTGDPSAPAPRTGDPSWSPPGGDSLIYVYAICAAPSANVAAPLFSVCHGPLTAICAEVPASEFGPEVIDQHLRENAWLEARVLHHQATIAELAGQTDLLPMRFGTLFHTRERVAAMLAEYAEPFADQLQAVAGCDEWGVRLSVDRAQLQTHLSAASVAVQSLDEVITSAGEGVAYLQRRRRERVLSEEVEQTSAQISGECHALLAQQSRAAHLLDLPSHPQPGPQLLLNATYLVERADLEPFLHLIDRLRATHGPHFSLELSGPWPAYSFVQMP